MPLPLQQALGGVAPGYRRAMAPRRFSFPRDHAPHDGFRNEWWHVVGNVRTRRGKRYGFQATFFRIALAPPPPPNQASPARRRSRWAATQVWMAHAALTDSGEPGDPGNPGKHFAHERFAREALGLAGAVGAAGADSPPLDLWVGDWRLTGLGGEAAWELRVATDDFELDFALEPRTPPTLQGEQGFSRKSDAPGAASYYYSVSRLAVRGTLGKGGVAETETEAVSGLAWLDREWSSGALGPEQAGWDWFALQLDDGADLMFYRLRDRNGNGNRNGATDPHSAGSLRAPAGGITPLQASDVVLTPKRWWRSPGGARYPVAWEMAVNPLGKRWIVEAVVDDQELALSVAYWEGMVEVREAGKVGKVVGRGYLEMTGYR